MTQWVCCSACPSVCVGSKAAVMLASPPGSAGPQCPQLPPKSLSPPETQAPSCSPHALYKTRNTTDTNSAPQYNFVGSITLWYSFITVSAGLLLSSCKYRRQKQNMELCLKQWINTSQILLFALCSYFKI